MVTTDEQMVLIPQRLLRELLRYLDPVDDDGVEVPGGNGTWYVWMVEQLRPELERLPAAKAVLDETAARPGELVSIRVIEQATGFPQKDFKLQLASMSRTIRRLFGRKTWPLQATQGGDGMYYFMPSKVGEWWLAGNTHDAKATK